MSNMRSLAILFAGLICCFPTTTISCQEEQLEIQGAIQIGNSGDPVPDAGTIRWTGSDFEGYNGGEWLSLTTSSPIVDSSFFVTDIDGNIYPTVKIGTQIWLRTNLRTSRYNDGMPIEERTLMIDWGSTLDDSTGAYCWYENNQLVDLIYGKLYNWYAVSTGKLCPTSWHVPSDSEWTTLIDLLDILSVNPNISGVQSLVAGGKMKETGLLHWTNPNDATNESGLSALPGGFRNGSGEFASLGVQGNWWSSTQHGVGSQVWYRAIINQNASVFRYATHMRAGFAVRCIKD
jgi:uncharacterized protein (TIGR02145 family)